MPTYWQKTHYNSPLTTQARPELCPSLKGSNVFAVIRRNYILIALPKTLKIKCHEFTISGSFQFEFSANEGARPPISFPFSTDHTFN